MLLLPDITTLLPPAAAPLGCPAAVDGQPAIPHNSRVKIRLQSFGDWWVDRVPRLDPVRHHP